MTRFALFLPLLASVSFGQISSNTVFSKRSFLPEWRRPSIAALPKQAAHQTKEIKPRPRMEGSSTGYIENAIVGSQIRVRFDADFHLEDPDRAEFFYAKCGCYRGATGTAAFDPNAPGPGPGIAGRVNAQELHLNLEYAPLRRLSFFADVPERSVEFPSAIGNLSNASGFGDFETGFKAALVASEQTYVTFELTAFMPTGDAGRGLSTSHFSVQPMLLLNHRLTDRVTVAGQFGDWHPINGSAGIPTAGPNGFAGDVLIYGLGGSYDFRPGSELKISPVLEFVGWHVLGGFETATSGSVPASGTNIVNAKFGVRFSFKTHNSIYIGYGEELTHAFWYHEILRLEYRYAF